MTSALDASVPEKPPRRDTSESRGTGVEPFRVDPSCYADAARLQARCNTWDSAGLPQAVVRAGENSIDFKPTVDKHTPGVERVVQDGKVEYKIQAGTDAVQNARWVQDAVRQAEKSGGGTISLSEGTYRGNVTVRGDNISIRGQEGKTVFDMGDKAPVGTDSVFSMRGKNLTLDGVTIQNWRRGSDKGPVIGVEVGGGSEHVRLSNLTIKDLGSEGSGGNKSGWGAHAIRVMTDNGKEINDVVIQNAKVSNLKLGQHEAISFMAENGNIRNPKVIDSEIRAINNVGIVFEGSARGKVSDFEARGNRISDASSQGNLTYRETSAAGIQVDTNVQGGKIVGNTISRSDHGVVLESEKGGPVRNVDIIGNTFQNNKVAHVFADGSHQSGTAVERATIANNTYTPDAPILAKDNPGRIEGVVERNNTRGEKPAVAEIRPKTTEQAKPEDLKTLEDKNASMEQKAAAAARLHASLPKDTNGRATVKLKDGNTEREFQIEHTEVGKGIHVSAIFTKGADGKDHPVLRWVDRRGKIEQQCDTKGSCVSFQSKYAGEHMRESNIAAVKGIAIEPPKEKERQPVRPPEKERPVVRPPVDKLPPVRPPIDKLPPIEPKPLTDGSNPPRVVGQLNSWATMYTPRASEGGRFGNQPPRGEGAPVFLPNHTVQKFLQNPVAAGFAAAAGDPGTRGGAWGTMFRIPEMNNDNLIRQVTGMSKDQWLAKWGDAYKQKYGFDLTGIHFRIVDTGSAIKGTGRIDICVDVGTSNAPYIERYNSPDTKRRMHTEVLDKRIRYMYRKA